MKCAAPKCPAPSKGQRYVVDGVHICLACAEMNRDGKMVTLDDFVKLPPKWQELIGTDRQMIQEVLGHYDRYKDDGVQIQRG